MPFVPSVGRAALAQRDRSRGTRWESAEPEPPLDFACPEPVEGLGANGLLLFTNHDRSFRALGVRARDEDNAVPAVRPRTVPELFLDRVALTPAAEAFRYPADSGWKSLSWRETLDRVRALSRGLAELGLQREQCCAILSSTRIEWILADLGILCAGGVTSTIYPSSTPDECAYILGDSAAVVAFAEDDRQVAKLAQWRSQLPALRHVVSVDGSPSADGWVLTLADLEARGRALDGRDPARFEQIARSLRPDSLATLIYTSGTTGPPKGVELTHDCWVYEAEATETSGIVPEVPIQFLWLPLAHSFGKVLEAVQLKMGFATAVDGRIERIAQNLAEVRPTFVCAVPRVFEKIRTKIVAGARQAGPGRHALFRWAMAVGREVARRRREGRPPGRLLAAQKAMADWLVLERIRRFFGGRLEFLVSGSAPLARDVAEFFEALGVNILEGYGLTESSAGSFCNRPGRTKIGTVGLPVAGTEVRIAEDGEVLLRGRSIMRGYHNLPEATREALEGGWLHTGDIGRLDAEGFLTITDRKKDLIKTSGGKYVAPQELELRLKALCPYVSQVLVHGDRRNYVTALVTLDEQAIQVWAGERGLGRASPAELSARPEVRALLQRHVDELNAGLPHFAAVKRFAILPNEFTEQSGEVTPSHKLKRRVIEQRHRAVLDGLYGDVAAA